MLLKLSAAGALAASLLMASSANAAVVRDYELNNSLTDSAGSGVDIVNNGGTLTATGIDFGANQGPDVTGLSLSTYTITTRFDLTALDGFRKIVDFKNLASDNGLYNLGTDLNFFNDSFGPNGAFTAGTMATVVLTRNGSTNVVTGYVDGVQQLQFTDTAGDSAIGANLRFFEDDNVTANREASGGSVDFVKISDSVDVPGRGPGVPEPATWAMMVLGLGGAGVMLRRRRGQPALA